MATVTGITAEKAQEIEDASVVSGVINSSGRLILMTGDGTTIDAGQVTATGGATNQQLQDHAADTSTHGVSTVAGLTEAQTMSNKNFVTPTIGSFINAQHNHGSAAGGGPVDVDAVLASVDNELTTRTLASGEVGTPRVLATTDTLPPGKYLIIGTIRGFTLDSGTPTRVSLYLTTTAGTLRNTRIDVQSEQVSLQGGTNAIGWLENASDAVVSFMVEKQNTGAVADTSALGQLIAIRLSGMT